MNKNLEQNSRYFEAIILDELKVKNPLYIKVKILAKMPQNKIVDQMEDGTYKIHVSAPPVRGQANVELCRYLKKILKAKEVAIVSGGREKMKLIRISH